MKISTSILNMEKDIKNLEELNKTSTDYIHLDIMDGKFVDNFSDMYDFIKDNKINKLLDIHLMVEDVHSYIEKYSNLNPEYITFHIEVGNTLSLIKKIKDKNIKVGLAISPNTDILELEPYLKYIDLILIMSVEPGLGGQKFLENTYIKLEKINELKKDYSFQIEVDGGINFNNCKTINADIIVVGSYITKSDNYQKMIDTLK